MKQIHITETVLRDAQQSLIATRMPFSDFQGILDDMDKAGYHSVECWGGATFDSCLRYLNEDPWERLRNIKSHMKNTKLQMLLRGQNLLGYHHYSDDTVRRFVRKSIENGMDIIRIFDALNDLRNIETAVDECIKAGGHAQGCICYTLSPIHNLEMFVSLGKQIEQMGCHSLCIKDMAGIMSPKECFDLVSALKENISIPIYVHTHATTGLGYMTYLKAAEAGAAGIDCATSTFSGGTSQPATESLVYALTQMGYDCGVDTKELKKINDYFVPIKNKFTENGLFDPYVLSTKTDALVYQIPGGMLSNMIGQLKQFNAMDKYYDVLAEIPQVRKDFGYPPLVTPTSQIVGTQAVMNVLFGRYKTFPNESKGLLRGEYGKLPAPVNEEVRKMAIGNDKVITCRPADLLKPEIDKYREEIRDQATCEEDVLSYALFPKVAPKFFEYRSAHQTKIDSTMLNKDNKTMPV